MWARNVFAPRRAGLDLNARRNAFCPRPTVAGQIKTTSPLSARAQASTGQAAFWSASCSVNDQVRVDLPCLQVTWLGWCRRKRRRGFRASCWRLHGVRNSISAEFFPLVKPDQKRGPVQGSVRSGRSAFRSHSTRYSGMLQFRQILPVFPQTRYLSHGRLGATAVSRPWNSSWMVDVGQSSVPVRTFQSFLVALFENVQTPEDEIIAAILSVVQSTV